MHTEQPSSAQHCMRHAAGAAPTKQGNRGLGVDDLRSSKRRRRWRVANTVHRAAGCEGGPVRLTSYSLNCAAELPAIVLCCTCTSNPGAPVLWGSVRLGGSMCLQTQQRGRHTEHAVQCWLSGAAGGCSERLGLGRGPAPSAVQLPAPVTSGLLISPGGCCCSVAGLSYKSRPCAPVTQPPTRSVSAAIGLIISCCRWPAETPLSGEQLDAGFAGGGTGEAAGFCSRAGWSAALCVGPAVQWAGCVLRMACGWAAGRSFTRRVRCGQAL
jgi:hypothetical protein